MSSGARRFFASTPKAAGLALLASLLAPASTKAEEAGEAFQVSQWRVWAGAGLAFQSYSLDTTAGNSIRLPLKAGPLLTAMAEYSSSGLPAIFLEVERASFTFPAVAGVSTAGTSVSQLELRAGARISLGEGFRLSPGWYWRRRRADETLPIALVTGSVAHGASIEASFQVQAESAITNEISARLYLPIASREDFQQTGYSRSKLRFGFRYKGGYSLNHGLSIALAPELQVEQNTYGGTGTRRVSDARERWVTLALPLLVEGAF